MRRVAAAVPLLLALTTTLAARTQAVPPHAALFGAWFGGIFAPPAKVTRQECLAQPSVIFTRDVVMRAVLTSPAFAERLIAGVRVTATGYQLHLAPRHNASGPTFGCPNPDVLPVERLGDNKITFPGCTDFPFPLVRCSGG